MCTECWEEYGEPMLRSPEIERTAELVKAVYDHPEGSMGGDLHIVLDDWNIETEHIEFCAGEIGRNDRASPELLAIESELVDLLLPMSEEERASALGLAEGYGAAGLRE
jgi:hypothetical protein